MEVVPVLNVLLTLLVVQHLQHTSARWQRMCSALASIRLFKRLMACCCSWYTVHFQQLLRLICVPAPCKWITIAATQRPRLQHRCWRHIRLLQYPPLLALLSVLLLLLQPPLLLYTSCYQCCGCRCCSRGRAPR
jgi:hypothetical protein